MNYGYLGKKKIDKQENVIIDINLPNKEMWQLGSVGVFIILLNLKFLFLWYPAQSFF